MDEVEHRAKHPDELRMYDVIEDRFRALTQADLDQFERTTQTFGYWRRAQEALLEVTLEMAQGKREFGDLATHIREFKHNGNLIAGHTGIPPATTRPAA